MEKGPGTKPLRCAQKTRIDVETLEVHMVARSECRIPSLRKGIEAEFPVAAARTKSDITMRAVKSEGRRRSATSAPICLPVLLGPRQT